MRPMRWATTFAALMSVVALLTLPIGLSPAYAATPDMKSASWNGTVTYSPGFSVHGPPVIQHVTGAYTFSGCVGLGITGGSASFVGTTNLAVDCSNARHVPWFGAGPVTYSWSNGQTSYITGPASVFGNFAITSGLFTGGYFGATRGFFDSGNAGSCVTAPWTKDFQTGYPNDVSFYLPPAGPVSCTSPRVCDTTRSALASSSAPGLAVTVTGTPSVGTGSATLTIASGKLACPHVSPLSRPVANLTDTGFKPTDRLDVTATLPLASSTSAEQVCFHSTVPFKSQSSPTVAKAGTAFLLNCGQVANVAPCVTSSQQVGSNVAVRFVVPGGDPTFCIRLATGREAYAQHLGTGTVGTAYTAQFQTEGGIAPFHWNLTGDLPPGCAFNAISATISGTPTTKGKYDVVVHATDSEKPRGKAATLDIRITIT